MASGSLYQLFQPDVVPCNASTYNVFQKSSFVFSLEGSNLSLCGNGSWASGPGAFRIHTSTSATSGDDSPPVVFTARQDTGVVSWTSPLQPQGFKASFRQVNRTLCFLQLPVNQSQPPVLYLDVFSSSEEPIEFSVLFYPVDNYSLSTDTKYSITVGASTPQVHYFKFPKHTHTMKVHATTSSKICAIISVQNNSCPANDLLKNALYKGLYQTMSTNAFLTVKERQVENREFLIVVITTNYTVCHGSEPKGENETVLYEQVIEVEIKPLPSFFKFIGPMLYPLLIFLAIYIIFIVALTVDLCLPKPSWAPKCSCILLKPSPPPPDQHTEEEPLLDSQVINNGSSPLVTSHQPTYEATRDEPHTQPEAELKVHRLSKIPLKKLEKEYSVYSWNTITVGIFYGLPAFQLVLAQQLLVNSSGNQDLCYINFNCAHPLGALSAFNNVWSNIGYLALGFLFLILVFIRNTKLKRDRAKNKAYIDSHGVPQMFGIYYAMGIGMILEGFMSAFYHICPSGNNFQFDTAFMFIIGGLMIVKVFQARHPDINANAFIAFFSFAVVIFFTLLGIYLDHTKPWAVRLVLLAVGLVLITSFFISFYHFHDWRFSIFNTVKSYFTHSPKQWSITHKVRFLKLLVAVLINLIVAVFAVVLYKQLDVATAVLAFFLVNVIYFFLCYLIQKLWFREQWTLHPPILIVLIVLFWAAAFSFFFRAVTEWQLTPAESRDLNRDCILFDFYDNHDVWHFLSSFALFVSFLFVLTLDDGLINIRRCDIHIF